MEVCYKLNVLFKAPRLGEQMQYVLLHAYLDTKGLLCVAAVRTCAARTYAACANLCSSYLCKPVLPIPVLTLAAFPYANGCCPYLCRHTLACMGCSKY